MQNFSTIAGMQSRLFSLLKYLIGWPFSVLALFFIVKLIGSQSPAFLPHLQNINFSFLLYGVVSFLIYYFLRGYLWHLLLQNYQYNIPFKDVNFLWATSELRRFIPGNI